MVEDAKAVAKIHTVVGQRHGVDGSHVKAHVPRTREILLRDGQSVGACIDAVQPADARRYERGPASTAAARVEAHRIAR